MYLMAMDRKEEMLKNIEKAYLLDPLSAPISSSLANAYLILNRIEEAEKLLIRTLDLDPNFRAALHGLGWLEVQRGNYVKALEIFEDYKKKVDHSLKGVTPLGYVYGIMGETEKAKECLEKLQKRQILEPDSSLTMDFAIIYAGLKDYDKVFSYLEQAYEERSGGILFLRNPNWAEIQNDPRFKKLIVKLGWE
jgi:tetratricopeptide (TPR) repeat protein